MSAIKSVRKALISRSLGALPFKVALSAADALLKSQGFGQGASVANSGEDRVFGLIKSGTPTLVDVGGYVGDYTATFLRKFPKGRSIVFEPCAAHMDAMKKRLGAARNIEFVACALGAAPGQATIYADAEMSGLASMTRRRLDHFGLTMDKTQTVPVRCMDEVARQRSIGHIDLLKIDVEGHELDVLRGATDLLKRKAIGIVQFEFGGTHLDTRTSLQDYYYFFREHGMSLHIIRPHRQPQPLGRYREFYEQYRATNLLALPVSTN